MRLNGGRPKMPNGRPSAGLRIAFTIHRERR